jgi:hypothetical protein
MKEDHQLKQLIKQKQKEESLEISSTGYGLESVSNNIDEKNQSNQSSNNCGGL